MPKSVLSKAANGLKFYPLHRTREEYQQPWSWDRVRLGRYPVAELAKQKKCVPGAS